METRRCPICHEKVGKQARSFPFCSARCKPIDAGNWFEGAYRVDAERTEWSWGDEG